MAARRDASDVTRLLRQRTNCNGRNGDLGDLRLCRTLAFAFTRPGAAIQPQPEPEPEPPIYDGGGVINTSTNIVDGGSPTSVPTDTWTGGTPAAA